MFIPNFITQKNISKNFNRSAKKPFKFIDIPNDATYKLIDSNKELVQHRNNPIHIT